jgi:hypothetical protein
VIVNAPEHVTAMAELSEERFVGAIATWRERMRAHSDRAYVQLVVNEGPRRAPLSPTPTPALRAALRPGAVARERERAGAYGERTPERPARATSWSRRCGAERLVAIDEDAALICPWASRSPIELRVVPAPRGGPLRGGHAGRAMIRTALRCLAARFDGSPELNLWCSPPRRDGQSASTGTSTSPPASRIKAASSSPRASTSTSSRPSAAQRICAELPRGDLRRAVAPTGGESTSAAIAMFCADSARFFSPALEPLPRTSACRKPSYSAARTPRVGNPHPLGGWQCDRVVETWSGPVARVVGWAARVLRVWTCGLA